MDRRFNFHYLRDGAQAEGVTFSPVSKIHVAQMLDSFGVDYIEGGLQPRILKIWLFQGDKG